MALSRREMLTFGALTGGAMLIPLERSVLAAGQSRIAESALPAPFSVPFALPPVATRAKYDGTTDYYALTMREQATEIIPGYQTRIWGYNGSFPGPTFEVQAGSESGCATTATGYRPSHPTLGYTPYTSVHLHGSASLPQFDGYASDITYPGSCKDYHYPNCPGGADPLVPRPRRAPHRVERLHGLVRACTGCTMRWSSRCRSRRGYYDVPLDRQRRHVRHRRPAALRRRRQTACTGDVILVNGRPWPVMKVERRKYRFRILNASVVAVLPLSARQRASRWPSSAPTAA